jgi:DNA-binding MarR family transcriptional regulator
MTRLIGSLEELQLVVKVASAIDKRSVMVELTDAGRAKIGSLISEQSVVVSAKLEALTAEEINSLRGALEALEKLGSQNR